MAGSIIADQSISFQAMRDKLVEINKIVTDDPAVEAQRFGRRRNGRRRVGQQRPRERDSEAAGGAEDQHGRGDRAAASEAVARVAGASLYLQAVQDLRIGGRSTGAQYQYTLQSDSVKELNEWAPQVYRKLANPAATGGREQRSAGPRAGRDARHRPRDCGAHGDLGAGHRQHAVRRVRPAPGVGDLHAVESVSRGDGSGAAILAEPGWAEIFVRSREQQSAGSAERVFANTCPAIRRFR